MEQKNFCISSLYDLLNPDNINVRIANEKFHITRPYGLSNLHQINFRDFKGDLLPFTDIELPKLKADLIMMTNGLKTVNFEGENTLDLPAVFSYNRTSTNKIISINKAWTYKEEEEDQIIYNIQELFNLMNNKLKDYFTKTSTINYIFNTNYSNKKTLSDFIYLNELKTFGYNSLITEEDKMLLFIPASSELALLSIPSRYGCTSIYSNEDPTDARGSIAIFGDLEYSSSTINYKAWYFNEQTNGTFLTSSFNFNSPKFEINIPRLNNYTTILNNKAVNNLNTSNYIFFNFSDSLKYVVHFDQNKYLYVRWVIKDKTTGSASYQRYDSTKTDSDPESTKWATQLSPFISNIRYLFVITCGEMDTMNNRIYCWILAYYNNGGDVKYLLYRQYFGYDPNNDNKPVAGTDDNWGIEAPRELTEEQAGYIIRQSDYFMKGIQTYPSPPGLSITAEDRIAYYNIGNGIFYVPMLWNNINENTLSYVKLEGVKNNFTSYASNNYLLHDGIKYAYKTYSEMTTAAFIKNPSFESEYETTGALLGQMGNSGPLIMYNENEELTGKNALGISSAIATNVKCSGTDPSDNTVNITPTTTYLTTNDEELLTLKSISGGSGFLTGTAEIPQITFSNDYSLNFLLRIYTEPYYFELYTQKNYTQEGNDWSLNVVDSSLFFRSSNEHVLDTLEYLILLNYTYNDIVLKVSGFPNNDQVLFHINETSYINFKTMITDNTTQELIIELLSEEGDILTVELLKKLFGKITLSIDWVQ